MNAALAMACHPDLIEESGAVCNTSDLCKAQVPGPMGMTSMLPIAAVAVLLLAGCAVPQDDQNEDNDQDTGAPGSATACWSEPQIPLDAQQEVASTPLDPDARGDTLYMDMGFNGSHWPDLTGHEVVILDHGAFDLAFGAAKPLFENLTGAKVTNHAADDAGTALQLASQDRQAGGGSFDILYGIDNALMQKAVDAEIFDPYTPLLADRVQQAYRFVPESEGAWLATPVDHGTIALNGDPRILDELPALPDLVELADQTVAMDPRFSSPGLGFLVATVATFGAECAMDYWDALFDAGLTLTAGWTEAYEGRFSGGYGQFDDGTPSDKPIVVSYTTSPAYEMYYGYETRNLVLTEPQSTFQQIQTMGILRGADRVAAEAWIEFTLSDEFQALAPAYNAIYPVVDTPAAQAAVQEVFGDNAPEPGSFQPAGFSYQDLGDEVDGWVASWVDRYETHLAG